jgi:hypothetical protein
MEPATLAAPALQVAEGSGPAAPVSPDHLWPVTPALGK